MKRVRKIIHIDMDAFFASVEQLDHPEWKGRPVIVGGDPQRRGVVAAASYEARKYGVRSAMSAQRAHRLCPQGIFVSPRFSRYSEISQQLRAIYEEVTPWVEPLSLDEAYLDVTQNAWNEPSAGKVAQRLKATIREKVGLTASAGVGPNKFIAKVASDFKKPDGLVVVPPEKVESWVSDLPVRKFWGVGPATEKRLLDLNIRTGADIRRSSRENLESVLGSMGYFLWELAHGRDDRPVVPHEEPKSFGTEMTFQKDVWSMDRLEGVLVEQSRELEQSLMEAGYLARTIVLKVRYLDFSTVTRSVTDRFPQQKAKWIEEHAKFLLYSKTDAGVRGVRLIGLSVQHFVGINAPMQLPLPIHPL